MSSETWSQPEGEAPFTVTVYERWPGGPLQVRIPDDSFSGGYRRESLGHRDRERAELYAIEMSLKLRKGVEDLQVGRTTWARLFATYQCHRTPKKGEQEQKADARRIELWTCVLGGDEDPISISLREWEALIEDRTSGALDGRGRRVPAEANCPSCLGSDCDTCGGSGRVEPRQTVRPRTVERDLTFLNTVCSWGTRWRTEAGAALLSQNPVRGYPIPREKNPRRSVATQDRYEATMGVAEEVHAFLPALLTLANETGRRLSAIRSLRYSDLHLETHPGSITWSEDRDKQGLRWEHIPISPAARECLDKLLRDRTGIGETPLFPAPRNPTKPVSRHLCDKWLRKAEARAGQEKLRGRLWHAYRAKFATEMVDLPDRVVAKLGGWKTPRTLDLYQQPGEDAMLRALERRRELRERGVAR